jgi:hypothetical protein
MSQSHPLSGAGPTGDLPPQVALFKAAHYVENYLELAEIVVEVLYDLLADRRKFTFTSGDLVRSAFDISERDILERWADVAPTTFDVMTPENAHTIGDTPKIWPALFDFLYFSTGDLGLTRLFLRWIHTAMTNALAEADFPILYQFQLNLLDQWFSLPHEAGTGITFDQLLQLLQAVAAFRAIVDQTLNFSFEDLKFTQEISGVVSLEVDGVVDVTLPEDAADFLSWSLNGQSYQITLHFDEIAMADGSEFALIVDHPYIKLRFPFGGSTNALRFFGVDAGLEVDPEHGPAHSAEFAPYHKFRDAYFTERPGESLASLDIDVEDVSFSLESTLLTSLLSAGVAYIDLWSSDDIDDLATLLGEIAVAAVRNLDDIGGLADKMAGALAAVVPNALACSTHDIHKPYLNDHYLLNYDRIRAKAEQGALIVFNEPPPDPEPADESDGPHHFPPPDGTDWPGILDQLDPDPNNGGGGDGRPSRLLDPLTLDAIRIPATYRAEYERRLAAAGPVPPQQLAAARLLIDGLDLRTVRYLHQRQVNLAARTVAGVPLSAPTVEALKRLAPAGGSIASFLFATGGQVASPSTMFATAFTPLTEKFSPPEVGIYYPSRYSAESSLDTRRGLAVDPGWIGLSVNSYAVDKVLSFVAGSGLLETSGQVVAPPSPTNPAPAPQEIYQYETKATDSLRLHADLEGDGGAGPIAVLTGLEVTLSRSGAKATYRLVGRTALRATHPPPGCLPDSMLMSIVQYAGCVGKLTGGKIADEDYRDDLLYRHFVYLEPLDNGTVVMEVQLVDGDPGGLSKGGFEPRPLLSAAIRDLWATRIARVPVLFDPFFALSPSIESFKARDGWLNVYEHYGLGV